ncbi:hypothetical protein LCGC14_0423460 [marine sediment metagenome]|uniref:Uncharacterized protein n=1 Tax=marine sediment metagenome TaxID=412755 RepID=A0A0F9VZE8_9ZZZZ
MRRKFYTQRTFYIRLSLLPVMLPLAVLNAIGESAENYARRLSKWVEGRFPYENRD